MFDENYKKLKLLKLSSMANYYRNYCSSPDFMKLDFNDRLAILLDF